MKQFADFRKRFMPMIEEEVPGGGLARIKWLIEHLENYYNRFIGFGQYPETKLSDVVHGDTFSLLVVALEVIHEDASEHLNDTEFPFSEVQQLRSNLQSLYETQTAEKLSTAKATFVQTNDALVCWKTKSDLAGSG